MNNFGFGAGVAGVGAGMGLGVYGDIMAQNAMNNQLASGMGTLAGFGTQGQGMFEGSLAQSGYKAGQGQRQQGANWFGQSMKPPLQGIGQFQPSRMGGQGLATADSWNRLSQGNAANMQGYRNMGQQSSINNTLTNGRLGMLGEQAQMAAAPIAPMMQQSAVQGKNLAALGSLGMTAGQLGALWAMMPGAQGQPMSRDPLGFNPQDYLTGFDAYPSGISLEQGGFAPSSFGGFELPATPSYGMGNLGLNYKL